MVIAPIRSDTSNRVRLQGIRDRVGALRPDLVPSSPRFDAAVLLFGLEYLPPNVDRLAARLRLARPFVARCVRHLFDNGVLDGHSLVTSWTHGGFDARAFWADVDVALGKWCRRTDESGSLQWVPAGRWWKSYDFVPDPEVKAECRTVYVPAEGRSACPDGLTVRARVRAPVWIGSEELPPRASDTRSEAPGQDPAARGEVDLSVNHSAPRNGELTLAMEGLASPSMAVWLG